MYEHKSHPLASSGVYYKRVLNNLLIALLVIIVWLLVGILGYHSTAEISWIDAVHNASMILSGMGPVATIETTGGKWFSSVYAILSGVIFITNIGVIIAPIAHRFFHKFHLEEK